MFYILIIFILFLIVILYNIGIILISQPPPRPPPNDLRDIKLPVCLCLNNHKTTATAGYEITPPPLHENHRQAIPYQSFSCQKNIIKNNCIFRLLSLSLHINKKVTKTMIETPFTIALCGIGITAMAIGIIIYVAIISYIGKPLRYDYSKDKKLERVGKISVLGGIALFIICATIATIMARP